MPRSWRVLHGPGQQLHQPGRRSRWLRGPGQPPAQVAAGDVLHRTVGLAVLFADFEDAHDVGVLKARRRLSLGAEACPLLGSGVAARRDHLEGHDPVQAELASPIDNAHTSVPQLSQDLVAADSRSIFRRRPAASGRGLRLSGCDGRTGPDRLRIGQTVGARYQPVQLGEHGEIVLETPLLAQPTAIRGVQLDQLPEQGHPARAGRVADVVGHLGRRHGLPRGLELIGDLVHPRQQVDRRGVIRLRSWLGHCDMAPGSGSALPRIRGLVHAGLRHDLPEREDAADLAPDGVLDAAHPFADFLVGIAGEVQLGKANELFR